MSLTDLLKIGSVASFELYPAPILGSVFKDVTVLAVLDQDTANFWIDTVAMHTNVYPMLPAGTPNNPNQYHYLKVRHSNGEVSIIGMPWIKPHTVVISDKRQLTLIFNQLDAVDMERIISAIHSVGYRVDITRFE